jgi:glucose/arabinose dehydrogenase
MAKVNIRDAKLEKVIKGLDKPWAFEFLNEQEVIISEFVGKLSVYNLKTKEHIYYQGLPDIATTKTQTGLLDIEIHPNFQFNKRIYFSYSVANQATPPLFATAAATAILENGQIKEFNQFILATPFQKSPSNFGGALEIDDSGYLYLSIGDRSSRNNAQKADRLQGKLLRFRLDTLEPEDKPLFANPKTDSRIYAMGLRNAQGLHYDRESNRLFETEHGPMGGDEVNIIEAGGNYGWPKITYGRNYTDKPIGVGTHLKGLKQPLYYYLPSKAISPITVYRGTMFPEWEGHLLVGALAGQQISKIHLDGEVIRSEQAILTELKQRVRDIKVAPDGSIYILSQSGPLFRLYRPEIVAGDEKPSSDGQRIYQAACSSCHNNGSGGAPRVGQAQDWKPILAARSFDTILNNAINGYKNMPAKGMCDDCSNTDIKMALKYMLSPINDPATNR